MKIVKLRDVWSFRIMKNANDRKYAVCGGLCSYEPKHLIEDFDNYDDAVNYLIHVAQQPNKDTEIRIKD